MDFLACESNAFHFDMEEATVALYDEGGTKKAACKAQIVERLVTMCATLNEYPYVRFQSDSPLSTELANDFQERINEFLKTNGKPRP